MKNFRVQIRAYGYYGDFNVESEDNSKAFEDALVDKLGKNDIKWDICRAPAGALQISLRNEERSRNRVGGTATG